jgi:two-component system cell cycle response regulator
VIQSLIHADSSDFFRSIIQNICKEAGIHYIPTSSGSETLSLLEAETPDLVITAIELPDINGLELTRKIKQGPHEKLPVVVITSNDSLEMRREMFSLGIADYILKTLPLEDLKRSVLELLSPIGNRDNIDSRLKNLRIAVLDDSKVERHVVHSILTMNGFENVDLFADASEFHEAGFNYDLYLIDLILPDVSGEHVIRQIKAEKNPGLVIAVSGVDDSRAVSNIFLSGADDYITKPFDASIFTARILASSRTLILMRDLEEKNRTLHRMAITDGLTGLYNHRYIVSRLEKDLSSGKEDYGLLLFDLDHFKRINDSVGHLIGDRVLKATAKAIHQTAHPRGITGRYGGEEFLVLFPGATPDQVLELGEEIRRNVEKINPGYGLHITISGGGSVLQPEESLADFIRRIDSLLYIAKNTGRNRFIFEEAVE